METWLIIKSQTKGAEHMDNDILPAIAAEYKGKKVTLNKPFRTSGGKKKTRRRKKSKRKRKSRRARR